MIRIQNPNFSKEVKRELKRKKFFSRDVWVYYTIDNSTKTGTLTIKVYKSTDTYTEISTPIEFDSRLISHGMRDGGSIRRIVFSVYQTDTVLDLITQDHYLDAWKNAYDWEFKVYEKRKVKADTFYHISFIDFSNAKRTKSTRIQGVCFDYGEMIYLEENANE